MDNQLASGIARLLPFRHAFRKQRCLIPASGFYEWQLLPGGKHKQPFYIYSKDGNLLSFAGLWEKVTLNELAIETCTIITTDCNALLRPIHGRMFAILSPEAGMPGLTTMKCQMMSLFFAEAIKY